MLRLLRSLASLVGAVALVLISTSARAELIYGLTTTNQLVSFDSATPGIVSAPIPITGVLAGQSLVGIDFRPSTPGVLVGVALNTATDTGSVVVIDRLTGVATLINTLTGLTGNVFDYGVDFNPVANALRIVSNTNENLRITAGGTGTINTDSALTPASQSVDSIAYSNNVAGASSTTLYGIAVGPEPDQLVSIGGIGGVPSPNTGMIINIANLLPASPAFLGDNGFDISGATGTAYAMFRPDSGGANSLYTIDLTTGASTLVGAIGVTPGTLRDISVFNGSVPEPGSLALLTLALAGLGFARRRKPHEAT